MSNKKLNNNSQNIDELICKTLNDKIPHIMFSKRIPEYQNIETKLNNYIRENDIDVNSPMTYSDYISMSAIVSHSVIDIILDVMNDVYLQQKLDSIHNNDNNDDDDAEEDEEDDDEWY